MSSTPSDTGAFILREGQRQTRRPLGRAQRQISALTLAVLICIAAPAQCQDGAGWGAEAWDRARAALIASAPGSIGSAIDRWRQLVGTESAGFDAYAGFVMSWPGLPGQDQMRLAAEKSLAVYNVDDGRLIAFFDRFPPLSNPARASYALALARQGRPQAGTVALAAWRGGAMNDAAEAQIFARWGRSFTQADNDARLRALLADGATTQASRALARASANMRGIGQARLLLQMPASMTPAPDVPMAGPDAMEQVAAQSAAQAAAQPYGPGGAPVEAGPAYATPRPAYPPYAPQPYGPSPYGYPAPAITPPANPLPPQAVLDADAGYAYDNARSLLRQGNADLAAQALSQTPPLAAPGSTPIVDPRKWVALALRIGRGVGPSAQVTLARGAVRALGSSASVSGMDYGTRDDFTSLMWLGANAAYRNLGDRANAAFLYVAYAEAARSPMTRAKGFYWAGRMMAPINGMEAQRWFMAAAEFPDQFYGLLALEQLRRPIPPLADPPHPAPPPAMRAAFMASPLAQAVRELARNGDWQTTV
ncbi:MAG TPA: hypothetical protein VN222_14735, partial [Novosphingobium sp.]|nr:hypothetical protein [Novosphingobium sp.]